MEAPIEHRTIVPIAPSAAFTRFTADIQSWWPPEYTWSQDALASFGIEPHTGGFCYEIGPHGFRCDWGRVLEWDPPHRLTFTWQISPRREPVPDPSRASRVDLRFEDAGHGRTTVILTHSDFARHGEGASDYRDAMASPQGWPFIMQRFSDTAAESETNP